ncbi:mandelate racemase/muconate lactonizing enzyme family protein [Arthrobacter sp. YN]|uniref:mandelate racemase/muconate lactonizing enzyme family protein n=1 Tax=Arthrobacter sp. YN TaxID=2020486 RepID=UPI000B5F8E1A|nr:mandelate racemase/muconate lactonizing enzyme family protein [Arthrobacter sp. YN]ASN20103.1 mandelate racemase [Arthrobacter sp. YN]
MIRQPTLRRIETFPLEHQLPNGGFGPSKVSVLARSATLVKVTTSDGIVGWGESFGPPRIVAAYLEDLARAVIGKPLEVREGTWLNRLSTGYHLTTGGLHVAAISGLDTAMWDAAARTYDVPVSALLGGRVRDEVTAYASTGYYHDKGDSGPLRAYIEEAVAEGFTSAKIKIGSGVRDDAERTGIARELLGPTGVLMVDYNANATVDTVLASLREVTTFDPYWIEEPLPPDEIRGWAMLRNQTGLSLAAGEALYTRFGFRDYIAEKRIDVVQPNLSVCGGFTEAKVISQMATAWNLRVAPHVWGTGVLIAATLQLLSTLPTSPFGERNAYAPMLEYDRGENPFREGVLKEPILAQNGRVQVPTGSGLGVEINEDAVRMWALPTHTLDITSP